MRCDAMTEFARHKPVKLGKRADGMNRIEDGEQKERDEETPAQTDVKRVCLSVRLSCRFRRGVDAVHLQASGQQQCSTRQARRYRYRSSSSREKKKQQQQLRGKAGVYRVLVPSASSGTEPTRRSMREHGRRSTEHSRC